MLFASYAVLVMALRTRRLEPGFLTVPTIVTAWSQPGTYNVWYQRRPH